MNIVYLIGALIVYLGVNRLLRRILHDSSRSYVLSIVPTLLILYSLKLCFLFIIISSPHGYHANRGFNAKSWQEDRSIRFEMRNHILNNQLFIDKTKEELVQELGLPLNRGFHVSDTLSQWSYSMGSRGYGMGLKFYELKVHFEEGRSNKLEVEEHMD